MGTTQFHPAEPQLFAMDAEALLSRRYSRICWYFPGVRPLVEPRVWLSTHMPELFRCNRSICIGVDRFTSVIHPLSLGPALSERCAVTFVIVT